MTLITGNNRPRAFTMVELLIVVTIIAFVAGALVAAARNIMVRAQMASTSALVQRLTTATAMFRDDFGFYPPDDWGIVADDTCRPQNARDPNEDNPSRIDIRANANLILRLLYLYTPVAGSDLPSKQYLKLKASELKGGFTRDYRSPACPDPAGRFESAWEANTARPRKGLVVVDAWGRPLHYDCNSPARGPDPGGSGKYVIRPDRRVAVGGGWGTPIHNADGCDIFSCGPDGRTSHNNIIDDNQDGRIDASDPTEDGTMDPNTSLKIAPLIGEAEDDINNWTGK